MVNKILSNTFFQKLLLFPIIWLTILVGSDKRELLKIYENLEVIGQIKNEKEK